MTPDKLRDLVLVDGVRTPMADYNGAFAEVSAIELGAHAARVLLERTGVAPGEIDHTVIGNVMQTSPDAIYGARHVALKAGVPVERPALTVNRLCGSGIEAILSAAGGREGPGSLTGLTLPEFLALQLHGIPLIAPLSTACCGKSDARGRGARSALIRGLRGLPPFDGKQFPRLPWGGSPVADDDIDRIETWIEEGCPGALIGSIPLAGEVSVAAAMTSANGRRNSAETPLSSTAIGT